jgi:hypothetical protein
MGWEKVKETKMAYKIFGCNISRDDVILMDELKFIVEKRILRV